MAIKLDGHTITELKLKASDGSEVTKQLTEEGTIPTPTGSLSITANGTYDVTDKASAVVNVPAPEINLQTKTATVNGDVVADAGYDGLEKVIVAVSGDVPTLITKSITANGTYNASADNADGYSSVTVNVPAPVLPTLTNPASASDILSGKEALDGDGAKLTGTCTFDADTSDADAVASDIAEGKTAYVNGVKLTGTASGGADTPDFFNDSRATIYHKLCAQMGLTEFEIHINGTETENWDVNHTLGTVPNVVWVYPKSLSLSAITVQMGLCYKAVGTDNTGNRAYYHLDGTSYPAGEYEGAMAANKNPMNFFRGWVATTYTFVAAATETTVTLKPTAKKWAAGDYVLAVGTL